MAPKPPKPLKPTNPGIKARPTKNQRNTGPKKPWSRAEEIGRRVVDSINPFD